MDGNTIRKYVRERYAGIARQGTSCCGPATSCGCGGDAEPDSRKIGYSAAEIEAAGSIVSIRVFGEKPA